jgi:hypothetical protein
LVSKSNPKKVLQYYRGPKDQKPSKEWVAKVERRVHAFESNLSEGPFAKKASAAALAGLLALSPAAQADYSGNEPSAMQQTSAGLAVAQAGNEFHILNNGAVAFRFNTHVVPADDVQTAVLHFPSGHIEQYEYTRGKDPKVMYIKDADLAQDMSGYNGKFMVSFGNNGQSAVFNIDSTAVNEDLTRRDFLKGLGVAAGATALPKAARAAIDPTQSKDQEQEYNRFAGTEAGPLHATPKLDPKRKWNRVGIAQGANQFNIVLHKDFDLYLYFDVEMAVKDNDIMIELKNGEKFRFRSRPLRSDIFTVEDPRIAALLLNYEGKFNLYVDDETYTFNITSSPDAQKLYRMWKEGAHTI